MGRSSWRQYRRSGKPRAGVAAGWSSTAPERPGMMVEDATSPGHFHTPRCHGVPPVHMHGSGYFRAGLRCRLDKVGRPLSNASTDSGPPSPGCLSAPISPPWKEPAIPPAVLEAALFNAAGATEGAFSIPSWEAAHLGGPPTWDASVLGGTQFESNEMLSGILPEYRIHAEGEPHPQRQAVLRVRATFVEYWEPQASPSARRSRSEPPPSGLDAATLKSLLPDSLASRPGQACQILSPKVLSTPSGPSEWLQRCVPPPPSVLPPSFQDAQQSPPPPPATLNLYMGTSSVPLVPPISTASIESPQHDVGSAEALFWQPCAETSNNWSYEAPMYWPSSAEWQLADHNGYSLPTWPHQEVEQTNFYGSNAENQPPAWPHAQQEAPVASQGEKCWADVDDDDDSTCCEFQDVVLEGKMGLSELLAGSRQMAPPHAQRIHMQGYSRSELQLPRSRVSRKVPHADQQAALEIISCARMALGQQYHDATIWDLCRHDKHSSANVQNALYIAASTGYENNSSEGWTDSWAVVAGMQGNARQAFENLFANYALSRIFEVMPTFIVGTVCEELRGHAVEAAKHRFGCRCMIRLIRFHACQATEDEHVSALMNELLSSAGQLGRTQFGTHVVQELLDSGSQEQRSAVARALRGNLHRDAKNRFAGRIVEKAASVCCVDAVNEMMDELLGSVEAIQNLLNNEFGARVVKVLLGGQHARRAAEMIRLVPVASTRAGRLLLQDARRIISQQGSFAVQGMQGWAPAHGRGQH